MSVNYKDLADNDPGGELQSAFDKMRAETITVNPEYMVTYRTIGSLVGLAESAELEIAVKAASSIPEWVNTSLASDGIDVNDAQVSATLGVLVSEATAAKITELGNVVVPRRTGLKIGHLANARQMREEGRI